MPRDSRSHSARGARRPRRSLLRRVVLQGGRVLMLLVLLVGAVAVSSGLADEGARQTDTTASAKTTSDAVNASAAAEQDQQTLAARTARLLVAEDARVLGLVRKVPYRGAAYRVDTGRVDTVVLTARPTPYDRAALVDLGVLKPQGDGTDLLTASVLVAPGAKLFLRDDRPIHLRSDARGFASIVAWKAELRLTGTPGSPLQISSWAPGRGAADTTEGDGRSYIRTVGSRTQVSNVSLSDLGFWSGRTGGLAAEGGDESVASAGAAAAAASSPIAGRNALSVTDLATHRLHYGLYAHDISSGSVRRSQMLDSTLQGVLVHGRTHGLLLDATTARDSGADGISLARGTRDITLRGVTSDANAGDGLRIDGRPTAARATAGGGDPVPHGDVRVTGATLTDNAGSGVSVVGAVRVSVTASTVRGNTDGVTVRDTAADVQVVNNSVSTSRGFGIAVTDGPTAVTVSGNTVDGAQTGIALRASVADVTGNTVTHASEHGISLAGQLPGSEVQSNQLAGAGTSAVSSSRLVAPSTVVVGANDVTGWDVRSDETWSQKVGDHPLLLLWLPILLVPLVGWLISLRLRRRRAADRSGRSRSARALVADTASGDTDHPALLEQPTSRTRVTVIA